MSSSVNRISSKQDLCHFISLDLAARGLKRLPRFYWLRKPILRYMTMLRRLEYLINAPDVRCRSLRCKVLALRLKLYGAKLGFSISPNTCGPGLYLVHWGSIVISSKASLGANVRVHSCVNIGANTVIGDNAYIGPGAKILESIVLGDNVKVGANAVVTKSYLQGGVTLLGIPARPAIDQSLPDEA